MLFTFYIFIQQIQVLNIINTVYTLRFFSSKQSLFHNSNVFGSSVIHILYIYSTNFGTKYFKHGIYSPFFSSYAVFFIILTYLVPVLFTFYIFIQHILVLNILNTVYILRFSLQNAFCFIILTYLVPVLFTFYLQYVLKFKKKIIPSPKY